MPQLTLHLLGSFQASLDGISITTFETHKVRALLAYLAVEADRPHTRDELVGLLWPDQPEQAARASLRQALANLRNAIGDRVAESPILHVMPDSIQFQRSGNCWIDVAAFTDLIAASQSHAHRQLATCRSCARRFQQATELYRGDFLVQFVQSDSEAFEEWVLLRRERLHRAALGALYHLAQHYERRSESEKALQYAQRQLELDPWREEAHRQAMVAWALTGQRSAALAQYETCRRILQEELGVEPTRETTALCEQIRAGQLKPHTAKCSLPVSATPFIGRDKELAELGVLLENPLCRLVTIVGPGGIGKTRLALAAAAEQAYAFDDGAVFVSLAALNSAEFIAPTIMAALDLPLSRQREPKEQLLACLREKELLLVLDNLEHVLEGCQLLSEILRRAPGVTLLVTSRERLRLQAEWLFDLTELRYPFSESVDTSTIEEYSAVQLFVACARRTQRKFVLEEGEVRAVARICQSVQGMPLAIELAAAAVRRRSCAAIAAEIESNLRALASEWRDAPERHRSVWAAFEHSWHLLTEEERLAFCRLSVFRGGFQEEAAAQVACASPSVLSALVEKSLLRGEATGRYNMHEVIRQYASEKLAGAHEVQQVSARHLACYVSLAESAESGLRNAEQVMWLMRLESDLDNVRAALVWSVKGGDAELGLRLAGALWRFWLLHGHIAEGRRWLDTLLEQTGKALPEQDAVSGMPERRHVARATMLSRAAYLTFLSGKLEDAATLAEAGLSLSRTAGDRAALGFALVVKGVVLARQGRDHAQALFEESLTVLDGIEHKWHVAAAYYRLGILAGIWHDNAGAEAWLEKSLALFRELGDRISVADVLLSLGQAIYGQNNTAKAVAVHQENLALYRELGVKGHMPINVLYALGQISLEQGDLERAGLLFQQCLVQSRDIGFTVKIVKALWGLALVAQYQGDAARATVLLEESLSLARNDGRRDWTASIQRSLGDVAASLGKFDGALRLYAESLMLAQGAPHEMWEIASSLRQIAVALCTQGRLVEAARLLGASESTREKTGRALPPLYRTDYERALSALRIQLGEAAFHAGWAEGRVMTTEQAINYAVALNDDPVMK